MTRPYPPARAKILNALSRMKCHFATAFSPAATQHFTGPDSFGRCKGLVPDFELKFNPRELGEVKGIVLGKVLYINRPPLVVTEG